MRLLPLLLLTGLAVATRRLSLTPCDPEVYILGQGAPTKTAGYTFGPQGIMEKMDARIDTTGRGKAQLAAIPPCLAEKAIPVKFFGPDGLRRALVWLKKRCEAQDCVVYTSMALKSITGIQIRPI